MLRDILRFNRAAPAVLATPGEGPLLGAFLAAGGYGEAFAEHYLLPMGAAIWSVPTEGLRAFPAKRIIEFLITTDSSLKTVPVVCGREGGSSAYLAPILATLPLGAAAARDPRRGLRREELGVRVRTDAGEVKRFDAIVLACHSDEALALLDDPSPRSAPFSAPCATRKMTSCSTTRPCCLGQGVRAAWNYRVSARGGLEHATVTYWMNALQHLRTKTPVLVTLNQSEAIRSEKVFERLRWAHPS